jgi:hypothetical protein
LLVFDSTFSYIKIIIEGETSFVEKNKLQVILVIGFVDLNL